MDVSLFKITFADLHSSRSMSIICWELLSQNSWPNFFSWNLISYFLTKLIKSFCVYCFKADMQKLGFDEINLLGFVFIFVKLHLPPPDILIFSPIFLEWSMIKTFFPLFPASIAHNIPAAPAPIIITSNLLTMDNSRNYEKY